jgi:AcrR family transcriptional regulator
MTTIFKPTIPPVENTSDKGPGTRRRLLDAAAELFASKGYSNVAVRDICERACANVAAVNYHFGGKDKLLIAAIDHARQRALQEDPVPASPKPEGKLDGQAKLRRHISAMLSRAFAIGPAGWYLQIVLREMVDPTPALKHAMQDHLGPHQRRLEAIVGQVLGEDPDSDRVKDTAAAILATAIYYHSCRPAVKYLRPDFVFDQKSAQRVTNAIVSMVLGGIAAE